MNRLRQLLQSRLTRNNLVIIILAALLIPIILIIQQFHTRKLLAEELDTRAESELIMKAILIKSTLNTAEKSLNDHIWTIRHNLDDPDSVYRAARWLVLKNKYLEGGGIGFVPYYYPQKGRLYEPYAQRVDSEVITRQIADEVTHDYTRMDFYRIPLEKGEPFWSDPYIDSVGKQNLISTFSIPVRDRKDNIAGVFGIDVSLDWLSDTINAHHIYPSSFNLLITDDGKLIVKPAPLHPKAHDVDQVLSMINDKTIAQDSSRTRRSVYLEFKSQADGERGCIYYANMKGNPHWKIAVVCYDDEVYGKLYNLTFTILLAMMAALAALGFIIVKFIIGERRLHDIHVKQERIGSELRIANKIQQGMLPPAPAGGLLHEDIDVRGSLVPAREVGGDLYNFFIRDEKLFFCIGDVSGKGVPSALVMAVTQALFYAGSQHMNNPARIMGTINNSITHNNERNMFVTIFIGILDIPTGRLRYCNAGHDTPMLMADKVTPLPVKANLPAGVIEDFNYEMQEHQFTPSSTLFLYTDGLTEAMDVKHRQFGRDRMTDTLAQCIGRRLTAGQMLDEMTSQVHQFVQGAEQSDDLTMLVIHYEPKTYQDLIDEEITLSNDIKQIPQLNAFVERVTDQLNFDTTLKHQMKLAVEEAVVNVMQYAYPNGNTGDVTIAAKTNGFTLKFIITDSGKPFDPTVAAKADTSLSVEERPIGGLGIFLVREMMDSINYERSNGKNILTLRKHFKHKNNKTDEN